RPSRSDIVTIVAQRLVHYAGPAKDATPQKRDTVSAVLERKGPLHKCSSPDVTEGSYATVSLDSPEVLLVLTTTLRISAFRSALRGRPQGGSGSIDLGLTLYKSAL